MINHIRDKIHLLDFEVCKKLVEVNPDSEKRRNECLNNIKNLKEALKKISELKNDKNNTFFKDDIEEEEGEEDEEKDEKEKNDEEKNNNLKNKN